MPYRPARTAPLPATPARGARDLPQEHWLNVLASIEEAVFVLDARGQIAFANSAAEELAGVSLARLHGRAGGGLFRSNTWIREMVEAARRRSAGQSRSGVDLVTPGRRIPVRATTTPLLAPEGGVAGTVLVLHDLRRPPGLEAASADAERVRQLEVLIAGLAHEIRNPLGGIRGAAELLRRHLVDPSWHRYTDLIMGETERLSLLLDRLLELGAPAPLARDPVNIHQVLRNVILLQQPAAPRITIRTDFDPSLPPAAGEADRLQQVFLNLVRNAVEAMPEGGTLSLTTRMEVGYHVRAEGGRRDQFLSVELTDTGAGIAEDDLERIFSPFYSTKRGGTGLGLAITRRIVSDHGGSIRVESCPGHGTTVRVILPVAAEGG